MVQQEIPYIDVNDKDRIGIQFFVVKEDGEDYVEVMVLGNRGKWIEWYPISEFQVRNPNIILVKKPENVGDQL